MNMTKLCNAITTAIERRPMVNRKTFLLVWNVDHVQVIQPERKKVEMKTIARLTHDDCADGMSGPRWDRIIGMTIVYIANAGKEADYG